MKPSLDEWLRFVVGVTMAITLVGIVGVVLYSLVFVTQPMVGQAPNDAEFFKLIGPIATFIVGALSGIMVGTQSNKVDSETPPRDPQAPVKQTWTGSGTPPKWVTDKETEQ